MRVAFISMSGVRVHNPRLAAAGLTLPGFVERGRVIASLPSLAGLTLAALTPPHVDFEYLEVADLDAHTIDPSFDLVALSTFTAMAYDAYALADRYRAAGIPVVMGGLHATLAPEEAKRHADAVCVGEGEAAWPRILEDARTGRLDPYYRTDRPYDLAMAPIPRYDLLDIGRYNRLTVQTTRGCPLDCEFCAASRVYGRYRRKPVERVMAEIDAVLRRWPRPFLELADDNTFVDRGWAKDLLRGMARRDLRWFTETDVSVADDPQLLDLLAASGCRQVLVGLESVVPESLDGLDAVRFKRRRLAGYRRAIEAIQSRGVTVNGCFILGLDGDTPETFDAIRDFVTDSGLLECQVTVLTPFPGTRLYRRLAAEGRLPREAAWERCTLFDVNFVPRRMTVAELEDGFLQLCRDLYSEDAVLRRKRLFMEQEKRRLVEAAC